MKKRNIMIGSAILLAVMLVAGGTMAWFTAEADPVANKFKAGTVALKINDTFVMENAQNVNPGDKYDKVVSITNEGTKRAYIRVKLTPEFDGEQDVSVVTYPILANWIYNSADGYYYYKNIVQPEALTTNIIEEVKFAGRDMGNEYQGASFTLTVEAEAIQATNGAINDQWGVDPVALGLDVLLTPITPAPVTP